MRFRPLWTMAVVSAPAIFGGTILVDQTGIEPISPFAKVTVTHNGPTSSGPIQITSDDRFVWVANPDRNTVTVLSVQKDANQKVAEIAVGKEPHSIAISPDDRTVFVANTVSGTVSVLRNPHHPKVTQTISVGTEPYALVLTPNGTKLYVANARSNDITVIDAKSLQVIGTIDQGVGLEPRALAVTNDGDTDDSDEKLYVTQFLGVDIPGKVVGADDYKEAHVGVFSTGTDELLGTAVLHPMANVGFNAAGDALHRIPPGTDFTFPTGAFPNQLNSVVIKGDHAYLPNTAPSPNGPVRFNVNLQAFLSVINLNSDTEGSTINMNRGINFETAGPNKVFFAVPWAAAFEHNSSTGYVVAAASNLLVKVDLDPSGVPTVHAPSAPGDPGAVVRVLVGQFPTGVVINSADTRAYVTNEISRDVSVVDLLTNQVIATVQSSDLPAPGTDEARLLIGEAVHNSSTGVKLPSLGIDFGTRLSSEGWSGCVSCHPFGHTDGVVWIFATGPRRTLQLNGTFNPRNPGDIKLLNHSGIRDEVQDFELNTRAVQGGKGLITLADGDTPDPNVFNLVPLASSGRSDLLDDLAFWVAHVRTPISPLASAPRGSQDAQLIAHGRELFAAANCQSCHGGGGWSVARRTFTPPPDASLIKGAEIIGGLRQVGTFDPNAVNEVRDNASAPLGADGFVPPSLLGAHAFPPSCITARRRRSPMC